jgi:hypothetical protein
VAVYPSLGSYSVVGFSVGITSFQKALHPIRKKVGANISLFQKSYSVFVDYSVLFLPSIYKEMGEVKSKPEILFFETPFIK